MSNYGIKISKNGVDVKTGDDIDMVVHSKRANLKGSLSGSGTQSVASGDLETVVINHGLDYPVIIRVFIKVGIPNADAYQEIPTFDTGSVFTQWDFIAYSDSTNAYIDFFWFDSLAGSSNSFDYKYLIFIDKGKL